MRFSRPKNYDAESNQGQKIMVQIEYGSFNEIAKKNNTIFGLKSLKSTQKLTLSIVLFLTKVRSILHFK